MKPDFMKDLTYNSYNKKQLFVYLKQTRDKMQKSKFSLYRAGHFFNNAYGLGYNTDEIYLLGHWIEEGDFLRYPEKFTDITPEW